MFSKIVGGRSRKSDSGADAMGSRGLGIFDYVKHTDFLDLELEYNFENLFRYNI